MIDIVNQTSATQREIGNRPVAVGSGRSLLLRRTYDATIEAVRSACTDPDRISRRLTPIDGDLRLGGVEVRLALGGDGVGTVLELEHAAPAEIVDEMARTYGPGTTVGRGVGWELALLGLDLFQGGVTFDPATWGDTPEAKEFVTAGSHAWGPAIQAAWGAGDDDLAAAVAFAAQHFAPVTGRDGGR
ncbi:hypothetical protein ABT158_30965 [Nonomuraea sp. NPDC001636]|uniref:hypothetical protein n=1 Tax=Nonomuraea sp. NPDC001636 TaxID=3154391 RepID=UPI003328F2C8